MARLLAHIEIDAETGCWRSTYSKLPDGYSQISVGRGKVGIHRASYFLFKGLVPKGYHVDHVYANGCRYRDCANPAHLEAVTQQENKKRKQLSITHCIHGHEYTVENTHWYKGNRWCRACDRTRPKRRKKAA